MHKVRHSMIQRFLLLHSPVVKGLSSLLQDTALSGRNGRLLNTCRQWQSVTATRKLHQVTEEKRWEEVRIPVPWGHIAGKWWGPRGIQPVLALHGWLDNAASFDPLISLLPESLSILAIDLPGHGHSSHYPPGCLYHYTEDLTTIRRIVKHFKWSDVSIMGHSLGSTFAFLYAALFPCEVKKIIGFDIIRPRFLDSNFFIETGGKEIDEIIDTWHYSKEAPQYQLTEILERQHRALNGSITRESCHILLTRGARKIAEGFSLTRDIRVKYFAFFHCLPHDFLNELASRITCEVLNIKAKDGTYFEPLEYYDQTLGKIRASAKSLEFYEMDGTHHVHLNNPESIVHLVEKFLSN